MQSTSCEMPGWMNNKLELRLPGEINNLRYADDITVMAEREEELKSLLMRVKEESKKAGLNFNSQKTKKENHSIWTHHFIAYRKGKCARSDRLYFLGLQYHCGW